MVKFKGWLILFLLIGNPLLARNRITLSQTTIYDQNIFRNYNAESDWVNQTALFLARETGFHSTRVRFYYNGKLNYFKEYSERLFHSHKLASDASIPVGGKHFLIAGFSWQRRFNQPDYQLYDYSNWLIYAQARINQWERLPIEAGYHLRKRVFHELSEFSFREHAGFFRLKYFFPTKTTLIAEINLAAKYYLEKQIIPQLIVRTDTLDSPGRGRGKGNQKVKVIQDTTLVASNLDVPQTNQVSILIKMAQSITPKTGLSLEYWRRFKPVQNTRYLAGQAYTYTQDDELYDDPYTYGSHEWELVLTQMLPGASRLRFLANLEYKNYLYNLSFSTEEKRTDDAWMLGIVFTKNLVLRRQLKNIEFYLSLFYLNNDSNEPYYDANGAIFTGGCNLNF